MEWGGGGGYIVVWILLLIEMLVSLFWSLEKERGKEFLN
jgi:hypothetical protein